MLMKYLAMLILAFGFAVSGFAQEIVYRWVDDEGTTHFSAQRPQGVDYEIVSTESGQVVSMPGDQADEESVDFSPTEFDQTDPSPDVVLELCAQAQEQLQLLETRPRLVVGHDNDQEELLDDDRRLELIEQTGTFLDDNCG